MKVRSESTLNFIFFTIKNSTFRYFNADKCINGNKYFNFLNSCKLVGQPWSLIALIAYAGLDQLSFLFRCLTYNRHYKGDDEEQ